MPPLIKKTIKPKKNSEVIQDQDNTSSILVMILLLIFLFVGLCFGWFLGDHLYRKYICFNKNDQNDTCPPLFPCMLNKESCPTLVPFDTNPKNDNNPSKTCPISTQCPQNTICFPSSSCPTPSTCAPITPCPTRSPCSLCPNVTPCPTCSNDNSFYNIRNIGGKCLDVTKTSLDTSTSRYFSDTCDLTNSNQKYFLNYFSNNEFQIRNSTKTTCLDSGTSPWSLTTCDNNKTSQRFIWDDDNTTDSFARIKTSSGKCLDLSNQQMNSDCNSSLFVNARKFQLLGIP